MNASNLLRQAPKLRAAAGRHSHLRGGSVIVTRSLASPSQDLGPDRTHMKDKPASDHKTNIQSAASKQAHEDRNAPSGQSQATSRRDDRNNNKRAEEDHPEAPKPVIGMNEERGSKGH